MTVLGNGVSSRNAYDVFDGRLTNVDSSISGLDLAYTFDWQGNVLTKEQGTNEYRYDYDHQSRLLSARYNGEIEEAFVYDGLGNIVEKDGNDYYYDEERIHQVRTIDNDDYIEHHYEYDENGT